MRLTPTTRPSAHIALDGNPQMIIPARTRSAMPLANIQPQDAGTRSRYVNDEAIWKTPSATKNAVSRNVNEYAPVTGCQISNTPTPPRGTT